MGNICLGSGMAHLWCYRMITTDGELTCCRVLLTLRRLPSSEGGRRVVVRLVA